MKRKLVVLNDRAFAKGGATALAIESALGAVHAGWDVSFITHKQGVPDPRLKEAGIRVIEVEGERVSGNAPARSLVSGIWNAQSARKLEDEISLTSASHTVFHVHNWSHFLSPSIFKVLKKHQDRVVASTHDFFMICGNGGQFNFQTKASCDLVGNSLKCRTTQCDKKNYAHKLWRSARLDMRQRTLSSADFSGVLSLVHPKQKPFFERAGFSRDNIQVVRNPVSPITQTRVKAERNRSILFIGRLDVEKGADIAAEAAYKAGVEIVFAGEGPLKSSIENTYPNAKTVGFCDRDQLHTLVKDARLLIMPSWLETFGLAAVEALWSGVPVLMSKNALLAEDIVAKGVGESFDPNDVNSIGQIINRLLEDDAQVKVMSDNAFKNCEDIANTPRQWVNANLSIYESMLPGESKHQARDLKPKKVALLNVHYSANLGDGLLSDCLAYGLENANASLDCFPVDLAGRTAIKNIRRIKTGRRPERPLASPRPGPADNDFDGSKILSQYIVATAL